METRMTQPAASPVPTTLETAAIVGRQDHVRAVAGQECQRHRREQASARQQAKEAASGEKSLKCAQRFFHVIASVCG